MIGSVFGVMFYGFTNQDTVVKYGNHKFTRSEQDSLWHFTNYDQGYTFNYLPQEVDFLNISDGFVAKLKDTLEIDTTSEPDSRFAESISVAQFSLSQNLPQKFIRIGFTENSTYDVPILTCDDATSNIPVIYFRSSNQTTIVEQGNCLIAESRDDYGFLRVKDRILYSILELI